MPIFLIVAVIVVIIAAFIFDRLAKQKRRDALTALAARLGMSFREEEDHALAQSLGFLRKLDDGSNRYVYNCLSGDYQGHAVMAFDFHYETYTHGKHGRQTHHHLFSVVTLQLPRSFPELLITPEGFFSKIAQAFGYDDIDMESAEFSRAFCVRSPDKKFAYDICHPLMMEYLLARRHLAIEYEGNVVALAFDTCLEATEIEPCLRQLVEIRDLMPDYLFTKN